jgi:hypothetical protein
MNSAASAPFYACISYIYRRTCYGKFVITLERESWRYTIVVAEGIFMLFIAMTYGFLCFPVSHIGENYRNGFHHLPE